MIRELDFWITRIWVILLYKLLILVEGLVECERNLEWVIEKGDNED